MGGVATPLMQVLKQKLATGRLPNSDDGYWVMTRLAFEAMPLRPMERVPVPVSTMAGTPKVVEASVLPGGNPDRAVIVGAGVEDMLGALVSNPDQWVISDHGGVISIIGPTGQAVELRAQDLLRIAAIQGAQTMLGRQ